MSNMASSQDRTVSFDLDGIAKGNKSVKIDSVIFRDTAWLKVKDSMNVFTVPSGSLRVDSAEQLFVYFANKEFVVSLPAMYFQTCSIGHRIAFVYFKKRMYYQVRDCTARVMTAPIRITKVKN